jgi:hypothetical protein
VAPHNNGLKDYHQRLNHVPGAEALANQVHTPLTAKRSIRDRLPAHCDGGIGLTPSSQRDHRPRSAGASSTPLSGAPYGPLSSASFLESSVILRGEVCW